MQICKRKVNQALVLLLVGLLSVGGCFIINVFAQETESENLGFEVLSHLMRMIGAAEEANKDVIADALEGLSTALITELEEQGVPEEALSQFEEEFGSALLLFEQGLFNRPQFADAVSRIARRLGQDVEGNLPTALLEEVGVNPEAINTLKEGAEALSGQQVAEIAQSIANRNREEGEEDQESEEKGEQEGKPDDDGPPDDKGPPEDKPGDNGKPDDAGPPEDKGPPEGKPDDNGKPDDAGPPE